MEQDMTQQRVSEAEFLAEVVRLSGTVLGASDWLDEALRIGLDASDDALSLARLCVEDGLSNTDPADAEWCAALKAALDDAALDDASR